MGLLKTLVLLNVMETRGSGVAWELVRNAVSGPSPDLLNQNHCLTRSSGSLLTV